MEEFRSIPGYDAYKVTKYGVVYNVVKRRIIRPYTVDGRLAVDAFYGSKTETLPISRAVALAWVPNPDPQTNTVVNHIDGNPLNNYFRNLEWTTYLGNNLHAIETGLRPDVLPCKIRDAFTGVVTEFPSIGYAVRFMGIPQCRQYHELKPMKFGKLLAGRYEFRYKDDPEPWFYESRPVMKVAARYKVAVYKDGDLVDEVFTQKDMLKRYQLYAAPGRSIPALAAYGNKIHQALKFEVMDGYAAATRYRPEHSVPKQRARPVIATYLPTGKIVRFSSITKAAKAHGVDKDTIQLRIAKERPLNEWKFAIEKSA